ncbi:MULTISPECIES: hypothetical protein [unclassified Paraburkholderia]|uniref:hypothetical protein n=1 Tax=unclassified Paraburkholderia TaxID=2615204 RepID=UPI00160C311F|nr:MULTISPECIES: hypothetical protein [unclassified Paraburkholderia]MBB5443642.1 hypothetical protein [Paraburkholderia sp. WSM4177]MBB5484137.1 hypothetical protein [Paraburkholderia sp. WSM4180]
MNECSITRLSELTPSYQEALRDCARFRPGTYVFKPVTMQRLSDLGLTSKTQSGAFCLTREGAALVRAWKEGSPK